MTKETNAKTLKIAGNNATEKKYDIFISYRRNGGETTAVLLKSELAHLGYNVFLDFDDLPIGGDFEKKIEEVIGASHLFLFLYSYGCLNRCKNEEDTLRKEIECAIKNGVQILTLNVNLASKYYIFPPKIANIPKGIIDALGKHNFLDFFTGQYKQDSLTRLAEFMATELDSLGFQKKKCTLALLSEIDADFVIDGVEWTALRAHTIKHIQISYGEYKNVQFRPIETSLFQETMPTTMVIASPMKELQVMIEDFPLKDKSSDEEIIINVDNKSPEEIRELGWDYQLEQKPRHALKCWRLAAERGDAAAQYSIGYQYSKGEILPRDEKEAFDWYLKAAKQGEPRAQFLLGDAYYYGSGIKRDFKQAVVWYQKASEQQNAKAQYSLACCYFKGNGVERNASKAFELYQQSAEGGYYNAQLLVARCYEHGTGIEKNLAEALKWYQEAAKQGSETAKIYCKRLENSSNKVS